MQRIEINIETGEQTVIPLTPEEIAALTAAAQPTLLDLRAYAAEKRWRVETGGIVVGGVPVPTDDRAKLLILGAATSMPEGSSAPLVIGGVNYGLLSDAQFKGLNAAIIAHVQATFPALAAVLSAIEAGTITTTAAIDAAEWPPNS